MLSDTKTKEILGNKKLNKEKMGQLRGEMNALAEIFFEELAAEGGSKQHSWVIDSATSNNGK